MYYQTFIPIRIPTGWNVTNNRFTEEVQELTYDDPEFLGSPEYDFLEFYSQGRNLYIS